MRQGKSLVELAQEIQRQAEVKRDYVADIRSLSVNENAQLNIDGVTALEEIGDHAHGQLAGALSIPRGFYEDLRGNHPGLWANTVNGLLQQRPAQRKLVRALDNGARAVLSDRYARIDHLPVLESVLPALGESGVKVLSCDVTPSKLYVKAVFPKLEGEVAVGDVVQGGVVISNSEIGLGAVEIKAFLYRLICTNGAVREADSTGLRRNHVGRRFAVATAAYEALVSEETQRLELAATLSQVGDVVNSFADPQAFQAYLGRWREAKERKIVGDVPGAVEALRPVLGLTVGESQSVLDHLIRGGDLSAYGLLNAVTRTAEDSESYDRATFLEAAGPKVIDLPPSHWRAVAEAEPISQ